MQVSDAKPSLSSRLVRRGILAAYRARGYTLVQTNPVPPRCVMLGVPHTTNWDFVFFLGAVTELGIKPSFMGKHSLFKWPMKRFMLDMGGVSVDRSAKGRNYVDQVVDAFAKARELALVIAPEGTRKAITSWRSGFYHIAHGAGVPIVPAWVDDKARHGGIGPAIIPSGDFETDLQAIARFYRSVLPDHPKLKILYSQAGIGDHDV